MLNSVRKPDQGIEPLTQTQMKRIVRNLLAACEDINKLNKTGYNFIYLASGFIAHYNLHGFIDFYEEPGSLAADILHFQPKNQWANFRLGERDYEYYMTKKIVYNSVCVELRKRGFQ
jgi:hypothetical protein